MTIGRRVVITGMGVRSPLGSDLDSHVEAIRNGRSGIVRADDWAWVEDLRSRVVGRADAGDPSIFPRALRRTMGRVGQLALGALTDAMSHSGVPVPLATGERAWLLVGSTLGALADIEHMFLRLRDTRTVLGSQTGGGLRSMAHTAAITCAMHLQFRGRLLTPSAACATGSLSVGLGFEAIRDGRADVALAGAADEQHVSTAATFDLLGAASSGFNEQPNCTPRPFDKRRDGIVCAEGAAFLVLEEREAAIRRGATIHGEVLGFATNSSGVAPTTPDEVAIARCMEIAMRDYGIEPTDVGYVNAHATGTVVGDAAEARAIARVFGDRVAVSSSKGHTGHTMAAAGAIEAALCVLMLGRRFVHPTLNLDEVSDDCAMVRHVRGCEDLAGRVVLSNNFALGGIHTCIALGSP